MRAPSSRFRFCLSTLFGAAAIGLGATPASAWWEYGHYTVADIAMDNVAPATAKKIEALLKRGTLLETPTCPVDTLAHAAYWADCVKTLGARFSYQYNWHYQNVNICKPFDVKGNCPDGNCVSAQVDRAEKLLGDKSVPTRERLMALANLAHFMGDLHQPMHAGDHADLGGNRVKADYGTVHNEHLNLHAIWDGYLAERAISTPPSIIRRYSPAERARLSAGSTTDWSRESWEVSRDVAYKYAIEGDPCATPTEKRGALSEAEIEATMPVVRDQIVKGGLRLARLLDEALKD